MTPVCESATTPLPGKFPVRAQILLAACGCAGASAFLFAVDPSQHAVYPQCWLYNSTGIYCAGCGATRALYALLHGNVFRALQDNALFVTALPVLLFIVGSHTLTAWRQQAWPQKEVDPISLIRWAIAILAVLLTFMAIRNLPGWPFNYLKPLP